jgi:hypothetical protein
LLKYLGLSKAIKPQMSSTKTYSNADFLSLNVCLRIWFY